MDKNFAIALVDSALRWIHIFAGITWIGLLYFFNWVNGPFAGTMDGETKKKVVPELMPRALYFFRWGAAWTWVTGILLAAWVYYMVDNLAKKDVVTDRSVIGHSAAVVVSLAVIVLAFFVYDAIWKALAKNEKAGVAVSYVLLVAVLFGLSRVFTGRAVFIHTGILFGTVMAMNVWMRIWPAQKKIIQGVKGVAPAADPAVAAMAGLRSKHNTYMSVPLVFAMVSNHYPTLYGWEHSWILISVLVLVGWIVTKWLYGRSASPTAAQYGQPAEQPTAAPSKA
jgi:uncharacterized membrane protein